MRRTAYIKALEEASKLPDEIPELRKINGGQITYSPRLLAIEAIKQDARKNELLCSIDLVEILNWPRPSDTDLLCTLTRACNEFFREIGYMDWKTKVQAIKAVFQNGFSHQLGTVTFATFHDAFRRVTNAKDNYDNSANNEA